MRRDKYRCTWLQHQAGRVRQRSGNPLQAGGVDALGRLVWMLRAQILQIHGPLARTQPSVLIERRGAFLVKDSCRRWGSPPPEGCESWDRCYMSTDPQKAAVLGLALSPRLLVFRQVQQARQNSSLRGKQATAIHALTPAWSRRRDLHSVQILCCDHSDTAP